MASVPLTGGFAGEGLEPAIRIALERLLVQSGVDTEEPLRLFSLLTRESLRLPTPPTGSPFSGICNDGTPWQYCVTLGSQSGGVRYLTEVGVPGTSLDDRNQLTLERLQTVYELLSYGPQAVERTAALRRLLPADPTRYPSLNAGLWIAVAHQGSRTMLRLYVNNGWSTELERWRRLAGLLLELHASSFTRRLRDLSQILVPAFSPSGVAISLGSSDTIKLYLRPKRAPWPAVEKLLDALEAPELLSQIEEGLGLELAEVPPKALVLSLGMGKDDSRPDVKLDLCCHCIGGEVVDTTVRIRNLAGRLGFDFSPYIKALQALSTLPTAPAFIGTGTHALSGTRINVYIAPSTGGTKRTQKVRRNDVSSRTREAIERGAAFLLSRFLPDHGWADFHLPVGSSTSWVTAYVADVWFRITGYRTRPDLQDVSRRAAELLRQVRRPEGWGYNERTPCDADSTALAVIFLRRVGDALPYAHQLFDRYQNADGGYATYSREDYGGGWVLSHSDVTPTVVRARYESYSEYGVRRAVALIRSSRLKSGLWPSYWWHTPLYATATSLQTLKLAGRKSAGDRGLLGIEPENNFESALLVQSLSHVGSQTPAAESLVLDLLCRQRPDGSWAPGAWLRVTDPQVRWPWLDPNASGRRYLDDGVFTTATALSAIAGWNQFSEPTA